MKGIYFSQIRDDKTYQGAVLKVFDEIKAFEKAGFEMRHVNATPLSAGLRSTHLGKGVCAAIPFTCVFSKFQYEKSFDEYDFYYFRFEAADFWLINFLKQLKKHNPDSKVLIEFPDYPNDIWLKKPAMFPIWLKDYCARKRYKGLVDRFVVLNPAYKEVYGVSTINYMNGIDISRIPARKPVIKTDDRIDAIGIGTMFPVHGFERFIKSMAYYYNNGGTRNIVFHIVGKGPGPELQKYINVTKETKMESHVVFEGELAGDELTECYNNCDLGVEVLALYRKGGLNLSSSLKSREYLARGVPIVSGCDIDILLGKEFRYWLRFDNDDSLINIDRIVEFYDKIYSNEPQTEVIHKIRQFAEDNCSYEATLRGVIGYLIEIGKDCSVL